MANASNLGYIPGLNLNTDMFTAEELAGAETQVAQFMADYAPSINLTKGSTLYDLIVRPRAVLTAISNRLSTALQATQSLKGVIDNPALASAEVVDAILSNRGMKRRIGSKATGTVKVSVSSDQIVSLHLELAFVTNSGMEFVPQQNYRATISPQNETDLQIFATDATNSQFYFLLPVVAKINGTASRLADLTELTPKPTIQNLISSLAFGNFQGGENDETNEELIAREPDSLAAKNHVSRVSIATTLKDQFPFVRDVSVQGMSDLGMLRNSANILSFKLGGYADVYVRTAQNISYGRINKTASLVEIDGTTSATYSVTIERDDFPGNYFVSKVNAANSGLQSSYVIVSEEKTVDNRPDGQIHLIPTNQDGVYSRYQKSTVVFRIEFDPDAGTNPVDQFPATIGVSLEVVGLPAIKEVQAFLSDPARGVVLADYLVKAPIPCFVRLSPIKVRASHGTSGESVRLAVFNYINSLPFGAEVRVDELLSVIKSVNGVRLVDLPIRIEGDIYSPDGTTLQIRSDNNLAIPTKPEVLVTPYTTAFFVELSDIPIAMIEV